MLIFPEFEHLKRLSRLVKICEYSQINRVLILSILLIDDKNNHEYFGHKYNISNNTKDSLNLFAKNLRLIKENKDFFNKDLEKNIYLYDKEHLINLNILNFTINSNIKPKDFFVNLRKILKSKTHKFTIDGKYLKEHGMQQGLLMGKVLKEIGEQNLIQKELGLSKI